MATIVEAHASLIPCRFIVADGPIDERLTVLVGQSTGTAMQPGRLVEVRPFAESDRHMGNRAMTTTVIIHPHPGAGLKVQVDLISAVDGGVNDTRYLKAGDPVLTLHAHDGMAVKVSEVKDELPREVEGDELHDA